MWDMLVRGRFRAKILLENGSHWYLVGKLNLNLCLFWAQRQITQEQTSGIWNLKTFHSFKKEKIDLNTKIISCISFFALSAQFVLCLNISVLRTKQNWYSLSWKLSNFIQIN